MKALLKRFGNGRISSFPAASFYFALAVCRAVSRKTVSILQLSRLGAHGKKCAIGRNVTMLYPGNINMQDQVQFADDCCISSEFHDSQLNIDSSSHICRGCKIDYSGGLHIGSHTVISEYTTIETHNHDLNPLDTPEKSPLHIGSHVWIGMHTVILPQTGEIGEGSIIGAGSVVTKPVPPHVIAVGNPARVIKQIDGKI